ncbi:MAG: lipoyl synthase [candidate division WOR-3 bacterium]|nr:MAG: lipoyl synthase [candidate division WOR-3 bacterium]
MFKRDHLRKPNWLKVSIPSGDEYKSIYRILQEKNLSTVCQEARCPNISECWKKKSATVMILGKVCTRACRFCAVKTGDPKGIIDPEEPDHVADVIRSLGLKYVVITSVDRDDLEDYGSQHYADTIKRITEKDPEVKVEALVPDFGGSEEFLRVVLNARPFVLGHNIETVRSLTRYIRDRRCSYDRSLAVLKKCTELDGSIITKSSLMVGLGETTEEISDALLDLKNVGVRIVTIGQYLQPTRKHLPVQRFYTPDEFDEFNRIGRGFGIEHVISGPLVRSSYHAAEILR